MPAAPRRGRLPLIRADLPERFTPQTLRGLDVSTLQRLSRPGNGILSAEDQTAFDEALRVVRQGTADRVDRALGRARRRGPGPSDPELRRSYERTQRRLEAQARRARATFPELDPAAVTPSEPGVAPPEVADEAPEDADVTLAVLESEIEQTSDTLEILERIASIEEQQLDHHRTQALRDTRGVFFALLVSIAVIVAGVAPLVEADSDDRRLILLWTLLICAAAVVGYAVARASQSRRRATSIDVDADDPS